MSIVEDFEELKPILLQKWLDYYKLNKNWLNRFALFLPTKPDCLIPETVLLILITLEPKLGLRMNDFQKVSKYMKIDFPDAEKWLKILTISNHKPTLDQQLQDLEKNKISLPPSPLDDFRQLAKEMEKTNQHSP
jgi:hypothetical protein